MGRAKVTKEVVAVEPKKEDTFVETSRGKIVDVAVKYKLTNMQKIFVKSMVATGGNKVESARLAGYKDGSEDTENFNLLSEKEKQQVTRSKLTFNASVLLRNEKIVNAIKEYGALYKEDRRDELEHDIYRIAKIRATYDPRKLIDTLVGATPEEIKEKIQALDEETALCIDGVEFRYYGSNANRFTCTMKWASRDTALTTLSKLSGLMVEKKEVNNIGNAMPTINIAVLNKGS